MKKQILLASLSLMSLIIGCNNQSNNKANEVTMADQPAEKILYRSEPLTPSEIAGTYKGDNQEFDLMNSAVKLKLNNDGTYKANIYLNGNEMTEDNLSPQVGRYTISIKENINKDNYGNVTDTWYAHTLECVWESPYGVRVSKYAIHPNEDPITGKKGPGYRLLSLHPSFIGNNVHVYQYNEY